MGTFFQLSVECGQDERLAKDVARHFDGYSFDLTETQKSICSARIIKDADLASWAIVHPSGLSISGISGAQEAQRMTTSGCHLYERLISSPPFRYAIAGVETEEFRTFLELKQMDAYLYGRLNGLVMSDETWENLGCPGGFVEFRDGYKWRPYEGEHAPRQNRIVDSSQT